MCKILLLLLFLGLTLTSPQGFAQNSQADTTFLQSSIKHAFGVYDKTIANQSHLYNGSEYIGYNSRIKGHQYFETKDWENGSVYYDGIWYTQVPMLYEIANDEVIIKHYNTFLKIRLVSNKIRSFSVLNHTFVRIESDPSNLSVIQSGFYDKLYDGQVKVFAKRAKYIQDNITQQGIDYEFLTKDSYFILKDNIYHSVKSKKSVLKLFEDKKKPLIKHLRENKIRFKKNNEQAIIKATQFYDVIVN